MQFLGGQKGKTILHLEAHLVTENGDRTRSCAVMFDSAFVQHPFTQIQILFHCLAFSF
jgi:hypothetical protein